MNQFLTVCCLESSRESVSLAEFLLCLESLVRIRFRCTILHDMKNAISEINAVGTGCSCRSGRGAACMAV